MVADSGVYALHGELEEINHVRGPSITYVMRINDTCEEVGGDPEPALASGYPVFRSPCPARRRGDSASVRPGSGRGYTGWMDTAAGLAAGSDEGEESPITLEEHLQRLATIGRLYMV